MRLIILFVITVLSLSAWANSSDGRQVKIVFASEMPEIHDGDTRYARLATLLEQQRAKNKDTFFFFGGGSLGPSILSSFDKGSHIIDLLNSLEPDAMGVSKREFSFYPENLSLRAYDATFPVVASNIIDTATEEELDGIVKSAISVHNDISIGFLSIIDSSVLEDYTFSQISLLDPLKAIESEAMSLRRNGADIILLHYTGYYPIINDLLERKVIDFSLHKDESYQDVDYSKRTYHNRDIFVKSASGVALLTMNVSPSLSKTFSSYSLDIVDVDRFPQNKVVATQVKGHINRLKSILAVEIGKFEVPITTRRTLVRSKENAFGNYIADSVRAFAKAPLAIINSGSIRGNRDYKKGEVISRGTIANELPFRGKLALIEINGAQLFEAMEHSVSALKVFRGRFAQISGMTVVYDSSQPVGTRIKSIKINGKDIKLTQLYQIATTDYLAAGGDGYDVFKQAKKLSAKHLAIRLVSDITSDKIAMDKVLAPTVDGRLIDLATKN